MLLYDACNNDVQEYSYACNLRNLNIFEEHADLTFSHVKNIFISINI